MQNDVEIGQFFVYKYAGLDEDGKWMIYDKNNEIVPAVDGTKSNLVAENKHFVGNAIPKVILSWDHTFRYKNWDLSVFLRSWLDYDVFSQVNMYYGLANDSQLNVLKSAYTRNRNIKDEKILCDYWIDDASFLKIDAINLAMAILPASFTAFTISPREQMSPYKINTILISGIPQHSFRSSGLFIAAITGFSSTASRKF